MEIEAAAGQFLVEFGRLHVAGNVQPDLAQPVALEVQRPGQLFRAHPEDPQRPHPGESGQEIGSRDTATPDGFVDNHRHLFPFARVQVPGVGDAVLDYRGGCRPRVPEELVEMGHVDHGYGALVRQRVQRERDVALGSVVFQVHGGKVHARAAAE